MIKDKVCKNCGQSFTPSKNDCRIVFCCTECRIEYRNKTGYMDSYYHANMKKWKDRQSEHEYKEEKNKSRRLKYAKDEEYRNRQKEKVKKYFNNHKDVKLTQRLKKYGLTVDGYRNLLKLQNGKCAICGAELADNVGNRLYVDHDHESGKIRGLLCAKCNFGIGQFNDDPDLLRKAITYLEG